MQASLIIDALKKQGVTHVVGVPDNGARTLFEALWADGDIDVIGVTREGEAYAIASGLYVGGMGAETKNFHKDMMARRGFPKEAERIQELFLAGRRDEAIAALGPVGSGYPSDPHTRQWIRQFLERDEELPPCVRRRWGTIDALRQQILFPS